VTEVRTRVVMWLRYGHVWLRIRIDDYGEILDDFMKDAEFLDTAVCRSYCTEW